MATDLPPMSAEFTARSNSRRPPDLLLAATLAALVFSWNYTVERVFDRDKLFDQYDVLFNADPVARLDAISHGKGDTNDLIIHPGFKLYFSRAIRVISKTARSVV